jgi:hypothetical protein
MAKESSEGGRSGFSGIFTIVELTDGEKEKLSEILKSFAKDGDSIEADLNSLVSLTAEVKAINNQATILHGERIKKAHTILTRYKDGAFTAWLLNAYGNRQTPYNLMQYYEFYTKMPIALRPQIEAMPRQAIYTLATRSGSLEEKQELISSYKGETKVQVLDLIRQKFPLESRDKRGVNVGIGVIQSLKKTADRLTEKPLNLTREQKNTIYDLLAHINQLINKN